jgi:hypothetical protein
MPGRVIYLPEAIWAALLKAFAKRAAHVEQVAFLDGVRSTDLSIVTTLTIPRARVEPGHYSVSAESMSQAGRHFREHGLARIAQVHTHPKNWTEHSAHDDEFAYSQGLGAVSVVLPNGGRGSPTLIQCGVLVRGENRWQVLRAEEIARLIRVVPSRLDFRPSGFWSPWVRRA